MKTSFLDKSHPILFYTRSRLFSSHSSFLIPTYPSQTAVHCFSSLSCFARRRIISPAPIPLSRHSSTSWLRQPLPTAAAAAASLNNYKNTVARIHHHQQLGRSDLIRATRASRARSGPKHCATGCATGTQLESSISSALYIAPLVAVVAFVLYEAIVPGQTGTADQAPDIELLIEELKEEEKEEMDALPGRPGNLTPEQEEKLRKFWEVFLQVCGVLGTEETGAADTPASLGEQGKTGTDKTKKKRHLSLFKKRDKKDKDSASEKTVSSTTTSDSTTTKADAAADDKWGENKLYQEVLAKHAPETIRSTIWGMVKHDHPDALLLRFLRARKWDVQKALSMLLSTMHWRASEAHVDDDIMLHGEKLAAEQEASSDEAVKKTGEDFLAQLRMGISYIHGEDKAGRLICVCKAALHRAGQHSEESLERYTVYLIETSRLMLKPPADTAVSFPIYLVYAYLGIYLRCDRSANHLGR